MCITRVYYLNYIEELSYFIEKVEPFGKELQEEYSQRNINYRLDIENTDQIVLNVARLKSSVQSLTEQAKKTRAEFIKEYEKRFNEKYVQDGDENEED